MPLDEIVDSGVQLQSPAVFANLGLYERAIS